MSQPSLLHLRNLTANANLRSQLGQKSIQRIMMAGLPGQFRWEFFPQAHFERDEGYIASRSSQFVEWGSIHLLFGRLAQHPQVDADVRGRIDAQKAELFFPACVQRDPPPRSQRDPVVAYGWDRARDAALVKRMQDECAALFLGCDRAAYAEAAPELAQYLKEAGGWYEKLARYITSPLYTRDFGATMKAGAQPLRDMLANMYTKLCILHEAGPNSGLAAPPQVMADLCQNVGLPLLDTLDLPGDAKDEIRNVSATDMTLPLHGDPARMLDPRACHRNGEGGCERRLGHQLPGSGRHNHWPRLRRGIHDRNGRDGRAEWSRRVGCWPLWFPVHPRLTGKTDSERDGEEGEAGRRAPGSPSRLVAVTGG